MTATQDRPATEIGKDRRRKEDQRLITGRTRWTDNITLPGMLHLAMVRSPFAHATITSIDVEAAKASPNVVTVLTGKDFGDELGVNINAWPITPDQKTPTHSPMPADRVAFAGEVVAVVVARSAAEARDAAELVDVEYDELPAVIGIKKALEDSGPRPPRPRHQQVGAVGLRLPGGRHRRRRRGRDRAGPHRRDPDRARVPPAAADPCLHGAAQRRGGPDRGADHHVVGDPDPAHPEVRPGGHHRRTRVEDPGHRPRRRWWFRRQAADDPRGVHRLGSGAPDGQAGEVHRDP